MLMNEPTIESPAEPAKPVLTGWHAPVSANTDADQIWISMMNEIIRFFWDRMQKDIEAQKAMVACASLGEVLKAQEKFVAVAQEQYGATAVKMLDMLSTATAAGLAASAKQRCYDDIPV